MVDEPVPIVAVLSGRDLVLHGLTAMAQSGGLNVRIVSAAELQGAAEVIVVDAMGLEADEAIRLEERVPDLAASIVMLISDRASAATATALSRWKRPLGAVVTDTSTTDEVTAILRASVARRQAGPLSSSAAPALAVATSVDVLTPSRDDVRPVAARGLSRREWEVLCLIASGLSNQQISEAMYLGLNTVKTYIRTAYRKLGVQSRTQAVIWAIEHGLTTETTARSPHSTPQQPAPRHAHAKGPSGDDGNW